jgi:serine/threonine-protein kinase
VIRIGSRFQREAEMLASLNHPNIATIYDLQEANGARYLVLELVEGKTLAIASRAGRSRLRKLSSLPNMSAKHSRQMCSSILSPGDPHLQPRYGKTRR